MFVAALLCPAPPDYEGYLGIYLKRISSKDHQYARVQPQTLCKLSFRGSIRTIYVRQSTLLAAQHVVQLRKGPLPAGGYKLIRVTRSPSNHVPAPIFPSRDYGWIPTGMAFTFKIIKGSSRLAGALALRRQDGEMLVIMLGWTAKWALAFDAAVMTEWEGFEKLEESFRPQAPGTFRNLHKHRVRVDAEVQIHSGFEYYLVDVSVQTVSQSENNKEQHQREQGTIEARNLKNRLRSSL
jgi:hypothetical protein